MKKFPKISVKFNWRGYTSKDGCHRVHLRVYYRGNTEYLSMNNVPRIHESDWANDPVNGLYVPSQPFLNDEINRQLNEVRQWSYQQVIQGRHLDVQTIKEHFVYPESGESFNAWCSYFVKNMNKDKASHEKRAHGTIQAYRSFLVKLDAFCSDISFEDLSTNLVLSFDRFLASRYDLRGRTRDKYFDKFKNCYKAAAKAGHVKFDPLLFSDIKFPNDTKDRVSLTKTEIGKLLRHQFEDPIDEFYKNIFLLGCFTSLMYSDIRNLKQENFGKESIVENGRKKEIEFIQGNRQKNNEAFVVPLFNQTKRILEEWSCWKSSRRNDPIFEGLISAQKYNDRLKKIAKMAGIHKRLSAKVARHSFSDLTRSMGMSEGHIQRAMGHKLISTQQHYGNMSLSGALFGWREPDI